MKNLQQKPVSFNEALTMIMSEAKKYPIQTETIPLFSALNRSLAENILADSDKPAAANSSMDGFCVNCATIAEASEQNPVVLPVVAGIDAGHRLETLPSRHCAYIATGATLPQGADAVECLERVPESPSTAQVTFTRPLSPGNFVRQKGAEQKKGELIASCGLTLTPQLIAICASSGVSSVKVAKRPTVGVLTSGDELVMPWENPAPWQVRNVNSLMLFHQISEAGGIPIDFGIARDDENHARQLFLRAVEQSDIIVTSGGISMGRKDPFRNIFAEFSIEPVIYGVKMKPGKPFFFGYFQNKPLFALPGNVVSTSVTFELFVRTFIRITQNLSPHRLKLSLPLSQPSFNDSGRDFFERGKLVTVNGEPMVEPLKKQESHMLSSFSATDLIYLHRFDNPKLDIGARVECTLLRNESA
jgi:molybdopterin molybdotransferase